MSCWCEEIMSYKRKTEKNGLNKYLIHFIGLTDYEDNRANVILNYNADEGINLRACGKLPKPAKINEIYIW